MFRAALLSAFVVYASAQSLSGQCTNALAGVATNPDAASCLSLGSLLPIATAGANTSVIPPINNWLTSLCGSPPCSNQTLAAVVQNVTTGCSTELGVLGFSSSMTSSITGLVQQYYPTVRKVACLKDGNTNCIVETLTKVQDAVGTLSITNILQLVQKGTSGLPTNISCSNCIKAAYNVIQTDVPSLVNDAKPALQSQCGAAFVDGSTPSGISQSATTSGGSSTSSKAAALGSVSMMSTSAITGLAVSGIVVVSTVFTFLA